MWGVVRKKAKQKSEMKEKRGDSRLREKKKKNSYGEEERKGTKTSDSGSSRVFRVTRRHKCLNARHEARFTRLRGCLKRAPTYTE